jgi:hypothetical protein
MLLATPWCFMRASGGRPWVYRRGARHEVQKQTTSQEEWPSEAGSDTSAALSGGCGAVQPAVSANGWPQVWWKVIITEGAAVQRRRLASRPRPCRLVTCRWDGSRDWKPQQQQQSEEASYCVCFCRAKAANLQLPQRSRSPQRLVVRQANGRRRQGGQSSTVVYVVRAGSFTQLGSIDGSALGGDRI